jgi:PIN domain nuclease of toxin-antitoxin system
MRLLLDTHVFLWWRSDAPELGARARKAISDAQNDVFVSAAASWEIVIKRALGRLEFDGTVEAALAEEGFAPLPVLVRHSDGVALLPDIHRDPFDRLMIAQALTERLTLVTADPFVMRYQGVELLRVSPSRVRVR